MKVSDLMLISLALAKAEVSGDGNFTLCWFATKNAQSPGVAALRVINASGGARETWLPVPVQIS